MIAVKAFKLFSYVMGAFILGCIALSIVANQLPVTTISR